MQLPIQTDLTNRVAVVTGGSGVLGATMSQALANAGATVVVLARDKNKIRSTVSKINGAGGKAYGYSVDVLDKEQLESVHQEIKENIGLCSILVNGAGGNHPGATTSNEYLEPAQDLENIEQSFFDLEQEDIKSLFHLNFLGTLLPTQVFAKDMLDIKGSTIINISSMNAFRPLTKIPAYSGAKAAISNFTEWLAVYFSKVGIRVNAIAPGFFLTEQNRDLLLQKDGEYTERAHKIISQTPMERFGEPKDLIGTLLWLVTEEASGFVNGIVVPVDGGFSAYSGV